MPAHEDLIMGLIVEAMLQAMSKPKSKVAIAGSSETAEKAKPSEGNDGSAKTPTQNGESNIAMPIQTRSKEKPRNILGNEFDVRFKDVDFERTQSGTIGLPEEMTLSEAAYWINTRITEEEKTVAITEKIIGFPIDVAHALGIAVKNLYGIRELKKTPGDFFSPDTPPTFRTVPIDHKGNTVDVFIGRFSIPGTEGFLETAAEGTAALHITGEMKQKDIPKLHALLHETKRVLKTESIYKGKAFRVEEKQSRQGPYLEMEFIDTTRVPAQLLLNDDTTQLVNGGLWVPITRTEQTRHFNNNGPVKRGGLLYGPPGTGKTLTALETARKAYENGWTFVYVKHVQQLANLYQFAARYAPVVVYAEDIDLLMKDESTGVNMLNNVLDGVDTKNQDIIVVLTTNYVDTLPRTLLRPGRFDTVIQYQAPDAKTSAALVRQFAMGQIDDENFDDKVVGKAVHGNIPATIAEVVARAKNFAISRYPQDYRGNLMLTTSDLVNSAHSMREHLRLLNRPEEKTESAMQQFGNVVGEFIVRGVSDAKRELKGEGREDNEYEPDEAGVTEPTEPLVRTAGN